MKLQKKLYNIAAAENLIDRSFNESKRTKDDDIGVPKFFQLYEKLFYNIPKTGQISHSSIINKSSTYAGGVIDNLTKDNTILRNRIFELEAQIEDLENAKNLIELDNNVKETEIFELKNS
tara:strand:+ start:1137 stop:1496 length:360 start_codon:yes stop_codon:yes gene_type:complete